MRAAREVKSSLATKRNGMHPVAMVGRGSWNWNSVPLCSAKVQEPIGTEVSRGDMVSRCLCTSEIGLLKVDSISDNNS
jgi:hypothetical protein